MNIVPDRADGSSNSPVTPDPAFSAGICLILPGRTVTIPENAQGGEPLYHGPRRRMRVRQDGNLVSRHCRGIAVAGEYRHALRERAD